MMDSPFDIGALYEEYQSSMYAFLRSRMHGAPPEDTEDLTSAVFERALRAAHTYHEQGQIRAWLYRIANNLLIDYWRSPRRQREFAISHDTPFGRATEDAGSTRHILMLDVADMLDGLRGNQRAAMTEFWMHGNPSSDTAQSLGVSVQAVKHLRRRAERKLRRTQQAAV